MPPCHLLRALVSTTCGLEWGAGKAELQEAGRFASLPRKVSDLALSGCSGTGWRMRMVAGSASMSSLRK